MDVLRYAGAPEKEKTRVLEYFNYITQVGGWELGS